MTIPIEILPRAGGKTTRLLEWMRAASGDERRVALCTTRLEAKQLRRENPDLDPTLFITLDYVPLGFHGYRGHTVVGVDNADLFLQHLIRYPVGFATWSKDTP